MLKHCLQQLNRLHDDQFFSILFLFICGCFLSPQNIMRKLGVMNGPSKCRSARKILVGGRLLGFKLNACARKEKRCACMLANARKDHLIPLN